MKLNKILVAALAVATLWSCQKDDVNPESTNPDESSVETVEKMFLGAKVDVIVLGDGAYQLGDLILFEENLTDVGEKIRTVEDPPVVQAAKLSRENVRLWTDNTVYYVIESNVNQRLRTVIQNSINEWESKTNVRFVSRTNQANYVTIRLSGQGCNCASASIGMNGSRGVINMGNGTTESVMIHEFGHTLGFPHEQNRADRDQFINVRTENITQGGLSQYRKSNSITPLTDAIDYRSIMMYSSRTFSNGRGPTMTIIENGVDTGQPVPGFGRNLTASDIEGTNRAYPGSVTNPNPNPTPTGDICDGVAEWQRQAYPIGAKVTYQGFLFERVSNGWKNLGKCGTPEPKDICDGVEEYDRNKQYRNGNKVTFRGDLYEAINGRWVLQGKCGA